MLLLSVAAHESYMYVSFATQGSNSLLRESLKKNIYIYVYVYIVFVLIISYSYIYGVLYL